MSSEWTFLVYMAGDNNLEDAGRDDLREMTRIGGTKDVNVLVQFDTEAQKTTRYRIDKGRATAVQKMPGVDCGDPKVLTEFIDWGTTNYPASRYAVVVWNHGGGWEDADIDYAANRAAKPFRAATLARAKRSMFRSTRELLTPLEVNDRLIAIDCGAQDYLDNQELRAAIAKTKVKKVDLLGFDACLMNMIEIAYEMRDTAQIVVGSEETEPGDGWPYTDVLGALTKNPKMATADLAKTIVESYGSFYRSAGGDTTQSAIDLAKVGAVADAVDGFANALVADLAAATPAIAVAQVRCLAFETDDYLDLGDFAKWIEGASTAPKSVQTAAAKVRAALADAVIAKAATGSKEAATGASIFFPRRRNRYVSAYKKLQFGARGWGKFLDAYLGP